MGTVSTISQPESMSSQEVFARQFWEVTSEVIQVTFVVMAFLVVCVTYKHLFMPCGFLIINIVYRYPR